MLPSRPHRWAVLLPLLCLLGCGAKQDQFEDVDWTKEPAPKQNSWREAQSLFQAAESDADLGNFELRGVRLDLTMSSQAKPDVRCSCVDAVVGALGDGKFSWAGERPLVSGKNMLFAFRTEGSQCGTQGVQRRPSIYAVDVRGRDVFVVLEELGTDRPQARGAIIRRPDPGGSVYIRPRRYRKQKLPYAQPVGQQMCLAFRRPGGGK